MECLENVFKASFLKGDGNPPTHAPDVCAIHASALTSWGLLLSIAPPSVVDGIVERCVLIHIFFTVMFVCFVIGISTLCEFLVLLTWCSNYSRTPLIRPPSESHWCGRIRGMVAREGFVYKQKALSVTRNVVV